MCFEIRSASMTVGTCVNPDGTSGMIDASTTLTPQCRRHARTLLPRPPRAVDPSRKCPRREEWAPPHGPVGQVVGRRAPRVRRGRRTVVGSPDGWRPRALAVALGESVDVERVAEAGELDPGRLGGVGRTQADVPREPGLRSTTSISKHRWVAGSRVGGRATDRALVARSSRAIEGRDRCRTGAWRRSA